MNVSRPEIDRCLARLVAAGIKPPAGVTAQAAAEFWTDKLGRYHPRAVLAAFERWLDERETWPVPKHLLPMVDAEQAKLERRIAPPRAQDGVAALNAALNEAMSRLPSSLLVQIYETERADPVVKRRFVNRFAQWAFDNPDAGPQDTAAAARAVLPVPLEAVA